jgi:acyl-CoA reductase-like NAD-dependent aldehyde dehydrogenase
MSVTMTGSPTPRQAAADYPPLAVSRVWRDVPLATRAKIIGRLRGKLVAHADELVEAVGTPFGRRKTDTLAAEIIPMADAARFIERNVAKLLRTRRLGRRGRPTWLMGVDASIRYEPFGVIAIIGPANYPLMLPGIQAMQALAAGNTVINKPAPASGKGEPLRLFAELLVQCGVPADAIHVLDDSIEAAKHAVDQADKIVLTGSHGTGRAVMRQLAESTKPSVMELSGCDAVFVMNGADLDRAAACLRFGLTFNGSATCIAPRRVFVARELHDALSERLQGLATARIAADVAVADLPAEDTLSPTLHLCPVDSMDEALAADAQCDYHLGASIFGPPPEAAALADRVNAGSVCINDIIAPTADPRLPFAGRGRSGFGATRGAEGLYEMVQIKAISHRRGGLTAHLDEPSELTGPMLHAILRAGHGETFTDKLRAWFDIARLGKQMNRKNKP